MLIISILLEGVLLCLLAMAEKLSFAASLDIVIYSIGVCWISSLRNLRLLSEWNVGCRSWVEMRNVFWLLTFLCSSTYRFLFPLNYTKCWRFSSTGGFTIKPALNIIRGDEPLEVQHTWQKVWGISIWHVECGNLKFHTCQRTRFFVSLALQDILMANAN